jgi:hypothetical protein
MHISEEQDEIISNYLRYEPDALYLLPHLDILPSHIKVLTTNEGEDGILIILGIDAFPDDFIKYKHANPMFMRAEAAVFCRNSKILIIDGVSDLDAVDMVEVQVEV